MGAGARSARGIGVTVATALVATLLTVGPAGAAPPDRDRDRAPMSAEQRRRHGERVATPREAEPVVPAVDAAVGDVPVEPMPLATPDVVWPEPSVVELDVAVPAEDQPGVVQVTPGPGRDRSDEAPGRARAQGAPEGALDAVAPVEVQVLDRGAAARAGVEGLLIRVEPVDEAPSQEAVPAGEGASDESVPAGEGTSAEAVSAQAMPAEAVPAEGVVVDVDYSGFAEAYGGDWSSRLRLVALPDCAVATPQIPSCRTGTPVETTNDVQSRTLSATVASTQMGVMAVTAAASGGSGNWGATPLSPSASWQVSGQTGSFSWAYPLRTPPMVTGPQPDLSISYSSGGLDGKVASTNNQSSWVGDGWDLDTGFIERKYVSCTQDATGSANNVTRKTGDLCWQSDNATMAFAGHSGELVKDAATGAWKLEADDGTRIERFTGGWNDDNDGEYWKVTTTDGTQYFFGRGQRSATDTTALGSAWSVPVFGNHSGEPCYAATFAASSCTQTWRWNLDHVVDPSGNTMTYVYEKETNRYGQNLNTASVEYVRGGYVSRIEYGQRAGAETGGLAPGRVVFAVAERCLPSGTVTCDPAQLTSANAKSWPDVPFDLICTSTTSCPTQTSPSFFTRKRLSTVTTQVASGTGYQSVDRWTMTHTFPDPGDGTSPVLWLSSIRQEGLVGSAVTLPEVSFSGTQMANRVDTVGDVGPPMNRYRLTAIVSEAGGTTTVNYTPKDCATGNVPAAPDSNTRRCFPVRWQPEGTGPQVTEYFHKYLVDTVVENSADTISSSVQTRWRYVGTPAWHYDDNPLVPAAERTWSEFRGYGTVDVITGKVAGQQSHERTRYFRGMHGDKLAAGGTRSVSVDGIADVERLNGFVRETITYDGLDGAELSGEVTTPWVSAPTATAADGKKATFLAPAQTESRVVAPALPAGRTTTRTVTTYDATYGNPTQVDDQGDTTTTADDRCTRIEYARNAAANITGAVKRSETVSVSCGTTPARPADVVADDRTLYDGGAYGAAPTRGLVTGRQRLKGWSGTTPVHVTEVTTTYDAYGRSVRSADAMGRASTTAYTPATGGPVTATTVTSPDPDGSGPVTASTTTVQLNPAWGIPVRMTDQNGKVTSATHDGLGRTTAVWQPGRAQGTKSANVTFAYTVSRTGVNTITTSTLTAAETYRTSVSLFDGMLRPRQTQEPSAAKDTPGRVVTDTVYDARGQVAFSHGEWFTTGAPSTSVVVPTAAVPARTRFEYDGAGRTTAEIFDVAQQERWRTTTTYGGDRVSVDPPDGETPRTTIVDARGRVVETRDHLGNAPTGTYQASTYSYDKAGQLATVKDAAGNTWSYAYDLLGRQTSSTDPNKGTTTATYDDTGAVLTSKDARGVTLAYVRDQLGRPTELRESGSTGTLRASWVYDTLQKGQLTSSTRYSGGAAYTTAVTGYDDEYRPTGQSVTIPSSEGALAGTYTTNLAYTADGQVRAMRLPAGGGLAAETLTTTFDSTSRPEWMTGGSGWGVYVASSLYDVYGEALRYDLGHTYAFLLNFQYESGTRRLQKTWVQREGVSGYDMDLAYSYDQAGNPTSFVDRPAGKPVDAQCFRYDGLRRLTSAWTPANGDCAPAPTVAALGGPARYWTDWTFDVSGNRKTEVSHAAAGDTTRTYAYPAAGGAFPNALTGVTQAGAAGAATSTFTYDAAGNTKTRAVPGASTQTLTWDAEGKLASVAQTGQPTASYVYTADGERLVRKQSGTTTVYLPGGQELTLTASTGAVTAVRYYSFGGQTVAMRTGTSGSTVKSLITDLHGTAMLSIDNTTKAVTQRRMDPYGGTRGAAVPWVGDRGFLNKPVDTTGLTQVGARYYDSAVGRFISVDPIMDMSRPQQWGGYSYSENNPITYADPTGLLSWRSAWNKVKNGARNAFNSTRSFVRKYQAEIVGGIAGVVVTGGCLVATGGAGSIGCMALGGAAAGAVTNLWRSKVQRTQPFSWGSLARDTLFGAAAGAAGGGLGRIAAAAAPAIRTGLSAAGNRGATAISNAVARIRTPAPRVNPAPKPAAAEDAVQFVSKRPDFVPRDNRGGAPGSRPSQDFTRAGKDEVRQRNAASYDDGIARCQAPGCSTKVTEPQQSQRGVTPRSDEAHVDHVVPKSGGGSGDPSNGQVLCRFHNLCKGASLPEDG